MIKELSLLFFSGDSRYLQYNLESAQSVQSFADEDVARERREFVLGFYQIDSIHGVRHR